VHAETNIWQRVEHGEFLQLAAVVFLLFWAALGLFFLFFWNAGWFGFSAACVTLAAVFLLRERILQRRWNAEDMTVLVEPVELRFRQEFSVSLRLSGEKAATVRWWRVELVGLVTEPGSKTLSPEVFAQLEFVVDPAPGEDRVTELRMVMTAPKRKDVADVNVTQDGWFVRTIVESDRGRMESGRVPVRLLDVTAQELLSE
jgi:hypothetical protein